MVRSAANTIFRCFVTILLFCSASGLHAATVPEDAGFQMLDNLPSAGDFRMVAGDGKPFKPADLKGKVVLLNFWRRDCRYCADEKQKLKKMVKDLNRPELQVLCVNLWDDPGWVRLQGKSETTGLAYVSGSGKGTDVVENTVRGRLMGYYVVNEDREAVYEVTGFPTTYVIDRQGRIAAYHVGLAKWDSAPVKKWVAGLLGPAEQPKGRISEDALPEWLDRLLDNGAAAGPRQGRISRLH
jgi:cytochrome oxidase Cu insertion factor (SCO1/SenC/PrrC family)